jgi:glycosyltransferase involved in cell wall biosynthesis
LAQALVRNRGEHDVILALNGLFLDTIEPIRAAFYGLLPQRNIRVWHAPWPVNQESEANTWRRQAAERTREAFLSSLNPSLVIVSSLFEGLQDDAVTSIGCLSQVVPTAAILYDLIPMLNRSPYLDEPKMAAWYENKLAHLRRADMLLAISECARQDAINHLSFPAENIVNISAAVGPEFRVQHIDGESAAIIRQRYGLQRPYVMYTGGVDFRKNIDGLIRAYVRLPAMLRQTHQLAVVCSLKVWEREYLQSLAKKSGMGLNELVLLGYVPDADLAALYSLCKVFVFPSKYEGFGLPALEAMACGRAVIGANTSSIPEVIGHDEALFDPFDDSAIADKLKQVLTDDTFRRTLELHGLEQSKLFDWDKTAQLAIHAMEEFVLKNKPVTFVLNKPTRRPRLAYVSPLPPERSGISDYSAELLPELSRYYDIEVVVDQDTVTDPWVKANCPVRTVAWLRAHATEFDRVLYQMGNSSFHQHMFSLLEDVPGVLVLHDFFLTNILEQMECAGSVPYVWTEALYAGHGYAAVWQRFHAAAAWKEYPCSYSVLQHAQGVVVHSEGARRLAQYWYGTQAFDDWTHIPLLRAPASIDATRRLHARSELGFRDSDFVVCSFGVLAPSKLIHRLLDVWFSSPLATNAQCTLVVVGGAAGGEYEKKLQKIVRKSGFFGRVRVVGWVDENTYRRYLTAADLAVQLRALSRGETSAAVLDCMNYAVATVVNANGNMADLPDEGVWKLPDDFTDEQLVKALTTLFEDVECRRELGFRARKIIQTKHTPRDCADQYFRAIECSQRSAANSVPALLHSIARLDSAPPDPGPFIALADAIDRSIAPNLVQRQLLVDVSELVQKDLKTGIQRVVRSIILELLMNPPADYRVEPVYSTGERPTYRYARQFTLGFLDCPVEALLDEPVSYRAGDMFICLDFHLDGVVAYRDFYQTMRRQGVSVQFVVYDLLLRNLSHCFPTDGAEKFEKWVSVVVESDGALCISKSVADEFGGWLATSGHARERPFNLGWFHLGADIKCSAPTDGLPDDSAIILARLRLGSVFLMVGTVEPRKRHAQTLSAFEQLWAQGLNLRLVIVGRQGWMVDELAEKLRGHPELGTRLFWLEGISDEYLEKIYANSTCLIAASEGEGFGLPLIEAAQHKLPIIARDIPIFREVAGESAYYFSGSEPSDLAVAIGNWVKLYMAGQHPVAATLPWLTWKESARQLLACAGIEAGNVGTGEVFI